VVLERVGHSFAGTVALRGLGGVFAGGPLHLLTGPNGSGKSTLLRIIGTTLRPSGGCVRFVPHLDFASIRAELGWVSHDCLVYPDLTGEENVRLAAGWHGLAGREAWGRASERFGLGQFSRRTVRAMSRGQRQRVALARALVHHPSLVLMDEPSTGLDEDGLRTLREVIGQELAAGALVLVVTHQIEAFAGFPCRRWHLDRGRWQDP
jgi:heme exporter protein A